MKIRMLKGWRSSTFSGEESIEYTIIVDDLANYLIKIGFAEPVPEPAYVPCKHVQEDWVGKTVRTKDALAYLTISGVSFKSNNVWIDNSVHTLEDMFQRFDWADGSPFGEVENG